MQFGYFILAIAMSLSQPLFAETMRICRGHHFGYKVTDPIDAQVYYICLGGLGEYAENCGSNNHFDEAQQRCIITSLISKDPILRRLDIFDQQKRCSCAQGTMREATQWDIPLIPIDSWYLRRQLPQTKTTTPFPIEYSTNPIAITSSTHSIEAITVSLFPSATYRPCGPAIVSTTMSPVSAMTTGPTTSEFSESTLPTEAITEDSTTILTSSSAFTTTEFFPSDSSSQTLTPTESCGPLNDTTTLIPVSPATESTNLQTTDATNSEFTTIPNSSSETCEKSAAPTCTSCSVSMTTESTTIPSVTCTPSIDNSSFETTSTSCFVLSTTNSAMRQQTVNDPLDSSKRDHQQHIPESKITDCRLFPNGAILRDSLLCNKYYKCKDGKPTTKYCIPGKWFDNELLICRPRNLVTNCHNNIY